MKNKNFIAKKKILILFGTRPEAIKMAPLIKALKSNKKFKTKICITAQHREMLDQVLNLFKIKPDFDLNIMKFQQELSDLVSTMIISISKILKTYRPNLVLVHGDTATTFSATLSAYHEKIIVGHVEAGLRSNDIYSPWPEEIYRKFTSSIAKFHFAPTCLSKKNLIKENINKNKIYVTGNTVIDALILVKNKITVNQKLKKKLSSFFSGINFSKKIILITYHRRENLGIGLDQICNCISKIAKTYEDVEIVFPVHLNPIIQKTVKKNLSKCRNIFIFDPLDYLPFVYLMMNSSLILTDSGGIQEEAIALKKPVLILRKNTERNEILNTKYAKLVGTDTKKILSEVKNFIKNQKSFKIDKMSKNPYGDGFAAKKIVSILEAELL